MKKTTLFFSLFFLAFHLPGQTIQVSAELALIKLTAQAYIHTCENNNGIVYFNKGHALIVSTPASDIETRNLIDWTVHEKEAKIVGYVIDRWHPDAMEGLDVVHEKGIKTYSHHFTRQIAKEKGLHVPREGFNTKTMIQVGGEKVICHYLGEAHTRDGIVVWIPGEQVLFGGNGIRNDKGWIGNIADANLYSWSATALRVKATYGMAKFVVPGHGKHGGPELIDYTIELYDLGELSKPAPASGAYLFHEMGPGEDFVVQSATDTLVDGKPVLANATMIAQDPTKYVVVESPRLTYQPGNKRIDSETGRVLLYDKTSKGPKLRTNVTYKKLILFKKEDPVGLRVILQGIE